MTFSAQIKLLFSVPQTTTHFQAVMQEYIELMKREQAQMAELKAILDAYEAEKQAYQERMEAHRRLMRELNQQPAKRM